MDRCLAVSGAHQASSTGLSVRWVHPQDQIQSCAIHSDHGNDTVNCINDLQWIILSENVGLSFSTKKY